MTTSTKKNDQKKIQELEAQLREMEEKYLRAAADMQNIRRRAEEERNRLPLLGKISLFEALLAHFDHAELALKNVPKAPNTWEHGIISILEGMFSALAVSGLEKIEATGVPVDPNIHDVLASEDGGADVVEVFQPGWKWGETVIRAAKVKAGKSQ